ncbi:MAG: Kae1-like domain-containing protein, partial [Planctomycetota bacterium]
MTPTRSTSPTSTRQSSRRAAVSTSSWSSTTTPILRRCWPSGYGADGTAWGGEVLVGDLRGFDRVGHLRPLRLPGGDAAARDTTRCGLSWLTDLLGADTADHQAARRMIPDEQRRNAIFGLLQRDLNCPPSSGLGRLFDAAAALLGVCDYNHY